jgi:hypothetical protein
MSRKEMIGWTVSNNHEIVQKLTARGGGYFRSARYPPLIVVGLRLHAAPSIISTDCCFERLSRDLGRGFRLLEWLLALCAGATYSVNV